MEFAAGSLVKYRDRDWVVQPSSDPDLILLKPLAGSEDEVTGIYKPLGFPDDKLATAEFAKPGPEDIGDLLSARLLYNAARLAIRNGAGPFRSFGKLSFRPRAYQMAPLILALRQTAPIRLLIADDVGIGKTIEALLILKELLERREIERFAIICLPHLCDQWQTELRDKFGVEAVVIRSNTQARLDREIYGDISVFRYYPYQVISIDYIKSDQRRQVFINECPEFVIVDEAHTCAKPGGLRASVQQQRYELIRDLSAKPLQHLLLLTATPHSGKPEEFQSLLGLIKPSFTTLDVPTATQDQRRQLAQHFIQRRRADVVQWVNEKTPFPQRNAGKGAAFDLSPLYEQAYDEVYEFALGLTRTSEENENRRRLRYWSALALLRGVISSPAAGAEMLKTRMEKVQADDADELNENPILDLDNDLEKDFPSAAVISNTDWNESEMRKLRRLAGQLESLTSLPHDHKAKTCLNLVRDWLKKEFHPIIFCRYIATANYLGTILKPELAEFADLDIQVITSEDPDEIRKQRIDDMKVHSRRLLIATDCLSEGINLQDLFTAVLHYDLPWNPNRLEQREGRVDRFGQTAPEVLTELLYARNNPIDGVVLKVLLEKVREIRRSTGISVPFPEDSRSLMDAVLQAVLLKGKSRQESDQIGFDFIDETYAQVKEMEIMRAIEQAAAREKASRSIFAQHSIRAEEIEQDLRQADDAIGDVAAVEAFVTMTLNNFIGAQIRPDKHGYVLYTTNLPESLKQLLPQGSTVKVSFASPTPHGYHYIGRNHAFVEQLCRTLLNAAIYRNSDNKPGRATVVRCAEVTIKTTLLLFRVRNVIEEKKSGRQMVAEEIYPMGYAGTAADFRLLEKEQLHDLLFKATPAGSLSSYAAADFLQQELEDLKAIQGPLDEVAYTRAETLVEAHERFRKVLGGSQYQTVQPVLPMDLLGIYILLPK